MCVDAPEKSAGVRAELGLPFPILCDSTRQVVRTWNLYNTKEMGGIAIPAVFVIGRDMQIGYRSIDTTATRVSTAGVLGFLRGEVSGAALGRERVPVRPGDFGRAFRNALRRGFKTPHG